MIELLHGENDFELTQTLKKRKVDFDGVVERVEGSELNGEQLADIFAGQTLFSLKRRIIIDSPSANSELWQNLPKWAERLSSDTEMLLVEPKPDKRTSTYKWLLKNATISIFEPLDDRNSAKVIAWIETYAKQANVKLTSQQIRRLQNRAGGNQWTLAHAIDKLALLDAVNDEWIDNVLEAQPIENVFILFETALNGDTKRLLEVLSTLRLTEDAYRVLGLLVSQALQLSVLVYGQGDIGRVARDTGARSSYPLQKLAPYANRLSKQEVATMIEVFAQADMRLKTSDADPWTVLESTLLGLASRQN